MRRCFILLILILVALTLASCGKKQQSKKQPVNNDPWKLVSIDPHGGCGTYLGNGSIGVRLHAEGIGWHNEPLKCLMAGMYKDEALAPLPNFSDLPIYLGDRAENSKRFELDPDEPYEQVLDMRNGTLTTKCTLRYGRRVLPVDIRFVVARDTDRVVINVSAQPQFNDNLTVRIGTCKVEAPWQVVKSASVGATTRQVLAMQGQSEKVYIATSFACSNSDFRTKSSLNGLASDITFDVDRDKRIEFAKSVDIERGERAFYTALRPVSLDDCKATASASEKAWIKLWESRIEIEGDPKAQQAVNSCMFYLLGSVREGTDYSIPPMGISNDAWTGHVFWDADTWMFPALLPQYPELAKSITAYRFKTLPGAKHNAMRRMLKGAEYAWESARTGFETIGMPFREERHITSDVALAQWQYYAATQDKKWLAQYGYPVISACADYWVSRVTYNSVQARHEILNIMSPDEDADIVNNSAYTNASAKKTLEVAVKAAKLLGRPVNPKWVSVAATMYIPFDKKNNRFVEYDGFDRKQSKQADTELLIYPLEHPMPDVLKVNTFDYWAKMVNPKGPAMSSSVHAVIAARLNRPEEAYRYFTESYDPFFRKPFNYFNEKRSEMYENMCFMTGAAGPIQAVIYGFCGLSYDNNGQIKATPHLPKKWKSVTLRNVYSAGKRYDIIMRHGAQPEFQLLD